eukprot:6347898-Pyramimonas_sp.AAC.1
MASGLQAAGHARGVREEGQRVSSSHREAARHRGCAFGDAAHPVRGSAGGRTQGGRAAGRGEVPGAASTEGRAHRGGSDP